MLRVSAEEIKDGIKHLINENKRLTAASDAQDRINAELEYANDQLRSKLVGVERLLDAGPPFILLDFRNVLKGVK